MGHIARAPPFYGGTTLTTTSHKRISWKNEAAGDIAASLPNFPDTMPVQQWHLMIILYLNAGPNVRSTRLEMLLHEEQPLAILAAALLQRCKDNEIANGMLANERTRETLRNCLDQVVDTVKQVPYGVTPTEEQLKQCAQGVIYVLISFRGAVYLSCSPSGVVNRETSMILDKVRVKHNDETSTDYLFRVNAIVTGHVRIWGQQMMIHAQAAMGGLLTTVVNNVSAEDRTRIMALVNRFLTTVLNRQTSKLTEDQIGQLLLSLAPFVHTVPLQNALEKVGPDGSSRMMLASPEDLGFITQNIFCFTPLWRFITDGLATETNTRPSGTVMHTDVFQMYNEGDSEKHLLEARMEQATKPPPTPPLPQETALTESRLSVMLADLHDQHSAKLEKVVLGQTVKNERLQAEHGHQLFMLQQQLRNLADHAGDLKHAGPVRDLARQVNAQATEVTKEVRGHDVYLAQQQPNRVRFSGDGAKGSAPRFQPRAAPKRKFTYEKDAEGFINSHVNHNEFDDFTPPLKNFYVSSGISTPELYKSKCSRVCTLCPADNYNMPHRECQCPAAFIGFTEKGMKQFGAVRVADKKRRVMDHIAQTTDSFTNAISVAMANDAESGDSLAQACADLQERFPCSDEDGIEHVMQLCCVAAMDVHSAISQ